jgi:hypothetical protein
MSSGNISRGPVYYGLARLEMFPKRALLASYQNITAAKVTPAATLSLILKGVMRDLHAHIKMILGNSQ